MLTTQDMLIADVTRHYTLQAIKQFYVVVLGLDVLGNPYGLITEYGKGFKDLFYEPYLVTFFIVSYYTSFNPSGPNPGQGEKIKLNFYFHTSLWCHKKVLLRP